MSITVSHSALSMLLLKQTKWASSWEYGTYHIGDQRRLRRACASAQSRQRQTKGPTKNQTSSPTGWLRMCVWRMSLWRTKSAIISWAGSNQLENDCSLLIPNWQAQKKFTFTTEVTGYASSRQTTLTFDNESYWFRQTRLNIDNERLWFTKANDTQLWQKNHWLMPHSG